MAERLQLMVAAEVPPVQIASRLGIDTQTVQTYEAIYFDVRRVLHRGAWMFIHVLLPLERSGNYQMSARFRAALSGGTAVLDALLSDEIKFPVDGTEPLFTKRVRLNALELEAINAIPLDEKSAWKFVHLAGRCLIESRRIELAEKRFDAKCLEAARDYELKRQKLEIERLKTESRLWHARSQAQSAETDNSTTGKSAARPYSKADAGTSEATPGATPAAKSA